MSDVHLSREPTREELARRNEIARREGREIVQINPLVVQTTFPETIREGIHGMINRMVDFNTVTRNTAPVSGIPWGRAVSQSPTQDIDATLGGSVTLFLGISVMDPTIVVPTGSGYAADVYPQYTSLTVLTKGEIFITAAPAITAGDPLYFVAADGILSNINTGILVAGGRWKYTRGAGALNVVQLGIQR